MDTKFHLRVRWPDGTILPIIIRSDALGRDIIKMLRFACGPKQELAILYNDVQIAADASIKSHGMKDGDTIQTIVKVRSQDAQRIINSLDRIAREAAKINDLHLSRIEGSSNAGGLLERENEEDNLRVDLPAPTVLAPKQKQLNSNPLPTFWDEGGPPSSEDDEKDVVPRYSTLEEASAFFSSQGRKWMW